MHNMEVNMIMLMKIDGDYNTAYDYVKCPVCKSRLCDKPKNEKISIIQVMNICSSKLNHIVVKCCSCGNKYLVSTLGN